MHVLPDILSERRAAAHASLELRIPDAGTGIDGHFPGHPIVAGVLQLDWAQRLGRGLFGIEQPVRSVSLLKFQAILRPGGTVTLELEYGGAGTPLRFAFRDGDRACSSGRLLF